MQHLDMNANDQGKKRMLISKEKLSEVMDDIDYHTLEVGEKWYAGEYAAILISWRLQEPHQSEMVEANRECIQRRDDWGYYAYR